MRGGVSKRSCARTPRSQSEYARMTTLQRAG
jgi:hypothetical protein